MVSIAALLWGAGGFAFALSFWLLGKYVLWPYALLSVRRHTSRSHAPQVNELWWQDGDLLYILGVNESGVEIVCAQEVNGKVEYLTWKDSWQDWHTRLRARMVYFTGQSRTLNR